jgi:hypothetical protein
VPIYSDKDSDKGNMAGPRILSEARDSGPGGSGGPDTPLLSHIVPLLPSPPLPACPPPVRDEAAGLGVAGVAPGTYMDIPIYNVSRVRSGYISGVYTYPRSGVPEGRGTYIDIHIYSISRVRSGYISGIYAYPCSGVPEGRECLR